MRLFSVTVEVDDDEGGILFLVVQAADEKDCRTVVGKMVPTDHDFVKVDVMMLEAPDGRTPKVLRRSN